MSVTYRGKPNRERFLAPGDKFRAKKVVQEPLMVPVVPVWVNLEEMRQAPETEKVVDIKPVVKPIMVESELIVDEPVIEKPKKRGRPKKVKEEKESEMF